MSRNNSISGGIGFPGALTILFIGLKLGGVIAWSWWWVLSPLWIVALLFFLIAFGYAAYLIITERKRRSTQRKAR